MLCVKSANQKFNMVIWNNGKTCVLNNIKVCESWSKVYKVIQSFLQAVTVVYQIIRRGSFRCMIVL